jgi:two-component system, NtrC family, sensor kinase
MSLTRKAPTAAKQSKPRRRDLAAVLAEREAELAEAHRQQAAVSEILQIINDSPGDLAAAFDAIVEKATLLCDAPCGGLWAVEGDLVRAVSTRHLPQAYREFLFREPVPLEQIFGRAARDRPFLQIDDLSATEAYRDRLPLTVASVELGGVRTYLGVPLREGGAVIGIINLIRQEARPFSESQIALVQAFAAHAQIAMKNARLIDETREALEQRKASADVLSVIGKSVSDTAPVFEAILDACQRLFGTQQVFVFTVGNDDMVRVAAWRGPPQAEEIRHDVTPLAESLTGRVIRERRIHHIPDHAVEPNLSPRLRDRIERLGSMSIVYAPLLWEDRGLGSISIGRSPPRPFSDREQALLQTFADQAAIAIENARLFRETQEALERQTAMADVLKVISRSAFDLNAVFDALLASAVSLIGGRGGTICVRDGEVFRYRADAEGRNSAMWRYLSEHPATPGRASVAGRVLLSGRPETICDTLSDSELKAPVHALTGSRSVVGVPLLRDDRVEGALMVGRTEAGAFDSRHIELLQTFADQAVIAIENARLFDEVQAKTRGLEEALQQQTATADVLKVISRSAFDLQVVLDTLVGSAASLFEAEKACIFQRRGDLYHWVSNFGFSDELVAHAKMHPFTAGSGSTTSRVASSRAPIHIPDVLADPDYVASEYQRLGDYRTILGVPLLRDREPIGVFIMTRHAVRPFNGRQIELLQSFADQAVIAIENVRLFDEVQARTRDLAEALQQQTATAEVLQVISRSTFDLESVFRTLVENAVRLCGARTGMIFQRDGEFMHLAASNGATQAFVDYVRGNPTAPDHGAATGRAALEGRAVHILDVEDDPEYSYGGGSLERYRTIVAVPLMRDKTSVGVFTLWRHHVEAFTPRQLALVETFADQAVVAIENARLFDEVQAKTRDLEESLAQQTATADVLKVISASAFDLDSVFTTLIERAGRLCGANRGTIFLRQGDVLLPAALYGLPEGTREALIANPLRVDDSSAGGRAVLTKSVCNVADVMTDPLYRRQDVASVAQYRSIIGVPLMQDGEAIGVFSLPRMEPGGFTPRQIETLRTFADQAVIAIENARLFDEVQAKTRDLEEALQQQTATADVLKVISRSAFDLQTVLESLISTAVRLCGARYGEIFRRYGDLYRFAATEAGAEPAYIEHELKTEIRPGRGTLIGRVALERRAVEIADAWSDPEYVEKGEARVGNLRAMLGVPLMRAGEPIGAFALARSTPQPFTERQVELVTTFADQAVIAIENVRLFDEVQAKTRDLEEALAQQTATADVLKAISRTAFDLDTVLQTLISTAVRLCDANGGEIFRRHGDVFRYAASLMDLGPAYLEHEQKAEIRAGRGTLIGRVAVEKRTVEIVDAWNDADYAEKEEVRVGGVRAMLGVPLMRNGELIGAFALGRTAPVAFTQRQIELVATFADQAVIAIENVRLFDEVQAKTRDLEESLAQQTATADVLKVISRSAFDLQAVFDTLIASAVELVGAVNGTICLREGESFRYRANSGLQSDFDIYLAEHPPIPGRASAAGRVILSGRVESIPDVLEDLDYVVPAYGLNKTRSLLGVPLLRNDRVEGALVLARVEPGPFSQREIDIVQTFADQAVIAIENVRLFDEVQARTKDLQEALQQQTATADVLKVISRSAFDLHAVLTTLAESARELCGASFVTLFMRDGDEMWLRAESGCTPEIVAFLHAHPIRAGRETFTGRVMASGEAVHLPDVLADAEYNFGEAPRIGNYRAVLGVPLLREGRVEGIFGLARPKPIPFTERQIEMVRAFADQAVIAIENARLFDEVQARTRELTASLEDLRKAQDRLIQSEKLASLGQLTAGIAHEIKNPLNFVNNFSALSRELLGELDDAIKSAPLDAPMREETDELIGAIGGNLDKVVQHGKRADSIVKNMLLHSREGSGERSMTNINAMVEEALNLAYHGARAEKPGFNVTIAKSLDPNAGAAEVYSQEITRVLLNLISNGFYATTKRKQSQGDGAYEPTITASTRDRGPSIEIAIRDNGTGIPDEVKAKMFNPFFTTKPAGEGTGLGLSLSHDIVVKQHGGTIEVSTERGAFTQFTIVLPRGAAGV